MAVNDDLLDATVRHDIGLRRHSTATLYKIIALLNRIDERLTAEIAKRDPGSGRFTDRRLNLLLDAVRAITKEAYNVVTENFDDEVRQLSAYESEYQIDMFRRIVPVEIDWVAPSEAQLYAAVHSRPFQGRLLREWYRDLEPSAYKRIRDTIRMGYVEGRTTDQIVRDIRGTRANGYRDGILEANRRGTEATVRTALNHTANTARAQVYKANSGVIKGVKWCATLDGRTSAICRARDGKIYPVDSGPRPPAHVNCLPGGTLVTSRYRVTGASKRWYDGQLVVIRTAAGKEVSCTPNHPILTDGGWVAANLLNVGDNVVCDGGGEWSAPALDVDHQNVPTAIEEIAEAVFRSLEMRTGPVPTAAEDFHGDGMDGHVAIVAANRFLADGVHAPFAEHGGEAFLIGRNMRLPRLACEGAFGEFLFGSLHAAHSVMGRLGSFGPVIWRGACHASRLLLGSVSKLDAIGFKYPSNGAGRNLVMIGNAANSYAGLEEFDSFINRDTDPRLEGVGAQVFPGVVESAENSVGSDAKLASDIIRGATGPVFLDDVVHIERRNFSGHVFNLETEKGFYVSGGIVTHNCRSSTAPVTKSWKELGLNLKEAPPGTRASMNGQVPDDLVYSSWLRQQPVEFQEEVLGKTKAKLFRKGEIDLDRFVDRAGNELTLAELRRKEAEAWEKAGLSTASG